LDRIFENIRWFRLRSAIHTAGFLREDKAQGRRMGGNAHRHRVDR